MAGTSDTTGDAIADFRTERFVEIGFDEEHARILATVRNEDGWFLDTHDVKRQFDDLRDKGCPPETAFRILAPLDAPIGVNEPAPEPVINDSVDEIATVNKGLDNAAESAVE